MKPELPEDVDEALAEVRTVVVSNEMIEQERVTWEEIVPAETLCVSSDDVVQLLRSQVFELVVIHHTDSLDALEWLPLVRSVGQENLAVIVFASASQEGLAARSLAASADGFLLGANDSELAKWTMIRAIERRRMLIESEQWRRTQVQSRTHDQQAAVHQIRALRGVLLESTSMMDDPVPPTWLVQKSKELLTAYVVSISGDLSDDVVDFVNCLRQSGVTLVEVLAAHSLATEQILLGLGNRPGWHVLGRSQLLAYEVMMQFSKDCDSKVPSVAV